MSLLVNQDSGVQAMNNKQYAWYNALVSALDLDAQTFQIVQSTVPVPSTSVELWQFFDSIPPHSSNQIFTPGGINSLSKDYLDVITTLLPQADKGFQWEKTMGDDLETWQTYKKTLTPESVSAAGGLTKVFDAWADIQMTAGKARQAKTIFVEIQNGNLGRAINAAYDPANYKDGVAKYTRTIDQLRADLVGTSERTIDYDSSTSSSSYEHTWAKGDLYGVGFFSFGHSSASYTEEDRTASNSRVTVKGTFQKAMSFAAEPGAWFDGDILNYARTTNDNTVWPQEQHPDWNDTFGPEGNMLRYAKTLEVVDGIDVTITSYANYSTSQQKKVHQHIHKHGLWPFFSGGSINKDYNYNASFNSSGNLVVTIKSPLGNPTILGVNVFPINDIV